MQSYPSWTKISAKQSQCEETPALQSADPITKMSDSLVFNLTETSKLNFCPCLICLDIIPGVDAMITIFCDFRQFSAKKLAFFSKTNVMIEIFAKTSSSLTKKRQYFC
jgi:hypothetical protein